MKIKWGVTAAALVLASGVAYAASGPGGWGCDGDSPRGMGQGMGMSGGMGGGMMQGMRGTLDPERMVERLDRALELDQAQRDQLSALLKSKFDQHQAQRPAMQAMMAQAAELNPADPDYLQKSGDLAKQRAAVMETHMAERAQVMVDIYAILTPEQQARFKALQKERGGKRGHGHGWGMGRS